MTSLRNKLIVLAVLGGIAVVGSLMNSKQAGAAGGPSVTIDGPLPLPVTGATTVSGPVAATQSEARNVGITGTPTVNANVTFPSSLAVTESGCAGRSYAGEHGLASPRIQGG